MRNNSVNSAHLVGPLGGVLPSEEKHLAGVLLSDLPSEVRATVTGVEGADIGIRLLETRVLSAGNSQIAHHVQGVPTAGRPAGNHRDNHLRHKPDQALNLENVEPPETVAGGTLRIIPLVILVAFATPDALVAARTESPATIFDTRSVTGQKHHTDARVLSGILKGLIQLINGVRAEGVSHLRTVKRDARDLPTIIVVVGHISEAVEARSLPPHGRIEQVGNNGCHGLSLASGRLFIAVEHCWGTLQRRNLRD